MPLLAVCTAIPAVQCAGSSEVSVAAPNMCRRHMTATQQVAVPDAVLHYLITCDALAVCLPCLLQHVQLSGAGHFI